MKEEQPRRKPRIPLSPEELYYFKKIKHLKEIKKEEEFRASSFYKNINRVNIVLAAFLAYCVFSVLIFCNWQKAYILNATCYYGEFDSVKEKYTISEIKITTTNGLVIPVKTSDLFQIPQQNEVVYIGRDFIFNKILKVKLAYDDRSFWHIYTYPLFTVCAFALCLGFFVYKVNKHLSVNGLITVFGLFILASLYFVLI
jgi:hypothetical protein